MNASQMINCVMDLAEKYRQTTTIQSTMVASDLRMLRHVAQGTMTHSQFSVVVGLKTKDCELVIDCQNTDMVKK